MTKIIKKFIRTSEQLSLNNNIFRVFLILMLFSSVISIIGNIITSFPMSANIKWIMAMIICFGGLWLIKLERFIEQFKLVIFLSTLFFLVIPSWFYGGGDNTITILYFMLIGIEAFLMLENSLFKWIVTFVTGISCFVLVTITNYYPDLIQKTGEQNVFIDSVIQIVIVFTIMTISIAIYTKQYRQQHRQLTDLNNDLELLASTDALCHTFNKRKILELLSQACDDKNVQSLYVVMIDIDSFKSINDEYGHIKGDLAIRHVANHLVDVVGEFGFVGRYGGDEFILVLCNQTDVEVEGLATHMLDIITLDGIKLSISAGVAKRVDDSTRGELLQKADEFLLNAKRKGKNRVEFWNT